MKRNDRAGMGILSGFSLNVLSDDELYELHLATLEVLQHTGVKVESAEALDIFDGGGAVVDRKTHVVKIPPYVVEEAIRSAPGKIILAGRNPKNDVVLEGRRVHFTNFGEGLMIVDPFTGEYRKTTKEDVANTALVVDALDGVDVYERAVDARDVYPGVGALHEAEAFFANTSKHCFMGPGNRKLAEKILDMAAAVVGGRENLQGRSPITFIACPSSPLQLCNDACDVIITAARAGVAVNILSMAMAGGSSPVTMAGTLISHNAEVLSGVVLNQLTVKGAPVIYGSSSTIMDLKYATAPVGSPELGMINAGVAKLAQYYLLPSFVAGG